MSARSGKYLNSSYEEEERLTPRKQYSDSRIFESDPPHIRNLKRLFHKIDKDGSNSIEIDEFGTIFRSYNIILSEEQIKNLMKEADTNDDGHVSFEEFYSFVKKKVPDLLVPIEERREELVNRMRELFDLFDKDGDGTISPSELKFCVRKISKRSVREEELEVLVRTIDQDNNGYIDFQEFEEMVHHNKYFMTILDDLLKPEPIQYLRGFTGIPHAFRKSYLYQLKHGGGDIHHVKNFVKPFLNIYTGLDYQDCVFGYYGESQVNEDSKLPEQGMTNTMMNTTLKTAASQNNKRKATITSASGRGTGGKSGGIILKKVDGLEKEKLFGIYPPGGTFKVSLKAAHAIPLPSRDVLERKAYICIYDEGMENQKEDNLLFGNTGNETTRLKKLRGESVTNDGGGMMTDRSILSSSSSTRRTTNEKKTRIVKGGVVSNIVEIKGMKHSQRDDTWKFPSSEKLIVRMDREISTYCLYIELVIVVSSKISSMKEISCGFLKVNLNRSFFLQKRFNNKRPRLIGGTIKEPQVISHKDISMTRRDVMGNIVNTLVGYSPPSLVLTIDTVDQKSPLEKLSLLPVHIVLKEKSIEILSLYRKWLSVELLRKQEVEEIRNSAILCDPLYEMLPDLLEDDIVWDVFVEQWNTAIKRNRALLKTEEQKISYLRKLVISLFPVTKCLTKPKKDYEEKHESKYRFFIKRFATRTNTTISDHYFRPFDCEEIRYQI